MKEYKLNQIKIKEISKLIRHNAVQPLQNSKCIKLKLMSI